MPDELFSAVNRMVAGGEGEGDAALSNEDQEWIQISRETYRSSTDYIESELRSKWEHSIALAKGKHAPGSKYYSDAFKHRSKMFRPKTKANLRQHEAACAAAYFSTADVASVEAGDDNDPAQQITAEILQELLNIRLGDGGIPWFLTLVGAYQNAMVQGAVASKQYWEYEEEESVDESVVDAFTGAPIKRVNILKDQPRIDLIPLENIRFDPNCDWTDPAGSSPYLITLMPKYAGDVMAKMQVVDGKTGEPEWKPMELAEILRHGSAPEEQNSTRDARRGNRRGDEGTIDGTEFSLVWVREYIARREGVDWIWYTLGDSVMLTKPVRVEEVYQHGRPIQIGYCMLEAFNPMPDSLVYTSRDLQAKANDVDNQRFDNIRVILNKRYFIKRSAKIDRKALFRSVPGGSVTMNDPNGDIRWDETRDVTGSSYQEQDRVNTDFDELTGSFSQSSVASNRAVKETVGGMQLLDKTADAVTEYQLRVFTETWVEPVLNQLAILLQKYETDQTILAVAAGKSKEFMRYGQDEVTDDLIDNRVTVRVNVGMGSTNPQQRVEKFMMGINAVAAMPGIAERIEGDEVISEIFGRLGYKDGSRFFKPIEEMQEQKPPPDPRIEAEKMRQEGQAQDREMEMQKFQMQLQADQQLEMAKMALSEDLTLRQLYEQLGADKEARLEDAKVKLSTAAIQEQGRRLAEQNKSKEMILKQQMGSGI